MTETNNDEGTGVAAGSELTFKAGKNLHVNRNEGVFTFALDKELKGLDSVHTKEIKLGDTAPISIKQDGDRITYQTDPNKAETKHTVANLEDELHIAPTANAVGKEGEAGYQAATHYKVVDNKVTLKYQDGTGKEVADKSAVIDLSDFAKSINNYSFSTNATGTNATGETNGKPVETTIATGKSVNFGAGDNLTVKQNVDNGNVTYTYGLQDVVTIGKNGKDGKDGENGAGVVINGKDGSIGLNGKDGKNGLSIKGEDGKVGIDGKDGETRLVYVEKADPNKPDDKDKTHKIATLDDGMKFGGDVGDVANVKLNKQVDVKGGVTDKAKLSEGNIGVVSTPNATTGGTELSVRLAKELKGLTSAEFKTDDNAPKTVITNNGIAITPVKPAEGQKAKSNVTLTENGLDNGNNVITNVTSALTTYNDANKPNNGLLNLSKEGDKVVSDNNAATVGDLRKMGWVVSSDKLTDDTSKAYNDTVKNADEVKFVGINGAKVSGKTDEKGVRTITVDVDAQKAVEEAQLPVVYTYTDGNKLVKVDGDFYREDDIDPATGKPVADAKVVETKDVIASMNNGDNDTEGTMALANVASHLPSVSDTNKDATDVDGFTKLSTKNTEAPITAAKAAEILEKSGDHAATVSDVLNAGWNLQGNNKAVDFVRPFDTINFVDGKGTEAVVTNENGTANKITYNVNAGDGIKVGDDNKVTIKTDGDTITVTDKGIKANTGSTETVKTENKEKGEKPGQVKPKEGDKDKLITIEKVVESVNSAYWTAAKAAHDESVNTESANGESAIHAGDKVEFASGKNMALKKDGNKFVYGTKDDVNFKTVNLTTAPDENGKTITTKIDGNGITIKPSDNNTKESVSLTNKGLDNGGNSITNVDSGLKTYGDKDGSKNGLVNLNNNNVDDHSAATVGDLRKMGWVVSSDKSTDDPNTAYSEHVKNADEVKFVGVNGAKVSGKTVNGVRTITVDVDAQKAVEEAQLPVVYTDADGNKLVKVGDEFYIEDDINPDTGKPMAEAKAVEKDNVIASMNNGHDSTQGNMALANVASHFPSVSDTDKDATDVDGITKLSTNNKVAPISAGKAAEILEKAGDHAATVSDVLNAGWGLKANGSAVDFVRPFDAVNFVNGTNTNVVAESDGVESKVKVNLNPDLKDLTSAEFKTKDDKGNATSTTTINGNGITIQPSEGNNKSVSLTNKGLDNAGNQIHNVKEGTDGKDAVNVDQLKQVEKKFTDGKLTFAGNTGKAYDAKMNTTVNIKGGKDNTDYAKFDEGKNIITKVEGDTLTIAMKKTPEVEGITLVDNGGHVKVKITQTDDGLKVADQDGNATRITNVKAGEKDTDAVNVKQLKDFASHIKNVEVKAGKNITSVNAATDKAGKTTYTIDAEDTTATVIATKEGAVKVVMSKAETRSNKVVTDYAVDLTDKAKDDIKKGVDAHTTVTTKGLTFNADKGSTGVKKLGDSVGVKGDGKNIETVADHNGVTVKLKDNINVKSVTVNNVNIDEKGIHAGEQRITNVADGRAPHDAVNVSQLKGVANNIHNHIGNVDRNSRAGIAGALAASQLPQAYLPGKNMVSVAAGNFRGQNGVALGMSRISDNGKVIIRLSGSANSQGHTGIAAGMGYQW
nr:YadA-like family protein [uncultured Haemophilus sp.]